MGITSFIREDFRYYLQAHTSFLTDGHGLLRFSRLPLKTKENKDTVTVIKGRKIACMQNMLTFFLSRHSQ